MWLQVALFVGSMLLSAALAPKPKTMHAQGVGRENFNVPTASEDREIPLQFGTRWIEGPNVVDWGDYREVPIWS